jgi:hypothetical protein
MMVNLFLSSLFFSSGENWLAYCVFLVKSETKALKMAFLTLVQQQQQRNKITQ